MWWFTPANSTSSAFAECSGSVPSIHVVIQLFVALLLGWLMLSFGLWPQCTQMVHIFTQRQTFTQTVRKIFFKQEIHVWAPFDRGL